MVLVFAEQQGGNFKKPTFEAVFYGKKLADALGTTCKALVIGNASNAGELGKYGAEEVLFLNNDKVQYFDSQVYTKAISSIASDINASHIVLSHSSTGKSLIGRIAISLDAAAISGVNSLPSNTSPLALTRPVFSGKAFADVTTSSDKVVISVVGNSLKPVEIGSSVNVTEVSVDLPAPKTTIKEVRRTAGNIPLPEAELVVSAGRGMKGPENWGIIDELAEVLGATTACSRPVADTGWRPHHEHVGQTGIAIRPNLYIAIGISGAIQHLAGVNNSKTIVVINKDPEAPFFKAADYGVLGDLFDVVPRLTLAIKEFKGA